MRHEASVPMDRIQAARGVIIERSGHAGRCSVAQRRMEGRCGKRRASERGAFTVRSLLPSIHRSLARFLRIMMAIEPIVSVL